MKSVFLYMTIIIGLLFLIIPTESFAVERGFKETKVNSGYTIITDEDAEIRRTGGHIVIEDLSTSNSKKIRRLQDEVAKLRAENTELKKDLKSFETKLKQQLKDMKTDLADLQQELRTQK